jgi:hypothetical protein
MYRSRWAVAGLVGSVLALSLAPVLMPEAYSWIAHTTSESAAQNVPGAWLARLGFVLFGTSVLAVCVMRSHDWGVGATAAHATFGLMMLVTAFASTRSWETGVAYNSVEDTVHSFAATAMGFAFAVGVMLVALRRKRTTGSIRLLDVVALVASIAIPLLMVAFGDVAGLAQRLMFALAYVWYGREASDPRRYRQSESLRTMDS